MLAITLLALTQICGALLMRGNKRIREIQNHLTLLCALLIRFQKLLVELRRFSKVTHSRSPELIHSLEN